MCNCTCGSHRFCRPHTATHAPSVVESEDGADDDERVDDDVEDAFPEYLWLWTASWKMRKAAFAAKKIPMATRNRSSTAKILADDKLEDRLLSPSLGRSDCELAIGMKWAWKDNRRDSHRRRDSGRVLPDRKRRH